MHILDSKRKESTKILKENTSFNCLDINELIGSKINALLVRTTPRDVYDTYNLFNKGFIKDKNFIRKIAIFYICLGSDIPIDFDLILQNALDKINNLNYQKIKETLIPVLHKGIKFDVKEVCNYVSKEIKELFILDSNDIKFISDFNNKIYNPTILFNSYEINDIKNHPMALWKMH